MQRTVRLEAGGTGLSNTGSATVVRGLRGETLPPVHVQRGTKGGETYYVHAAYLISASHHRGDGQWTVARCGIDRSARHRLTTEHAILWRGAIRDSVPDLAEVELCGRTRASLSGDLAAAVHEAARIATTYHYRWGGLPAGPRYGVGGRLGTSRVGVGYREGG